MRNIYCVIVNGVSLGAVAGEHIKTPRKLYIKNNDEIIADFNFENAELVEAADTAPFDKNFNIVMKI